MNLLWHRTEQNLSSIPYRGSENLYPEFSHWAEHILARLTNRVEFEADLRKAFPFQIFAHEFEVFDILHVPGRSLKILCRFHENSFRLALSIIQVNFYSEETCPKEYWKIKTNATRADCVALIAGWSAVARIFPEDSGLPGLAEMLDLKLVANLLNDAGANADPEGSSWNMLSYQSGKRCAIRYEFSESGTRFFGKIQEGSKAGITHRYLLKLWHHPARRFQMPKPLAFSSALGARWETFVEGISLETALQTSDMEPLLSEVTSHLVYLHDLSIADLPPTTPEMIMARITRKILRRMHSLVPKLAVRAEKIITTLHEKLSWTSNSPQVTLHGDFHIANFLINDKGLVFIDLDNLSKGDPCCDLALFGSRLILRNLHHNDRLAETLDLVSRLPELYATLSGRMIRQETFAWYIAALLIGRQIKSCMRVDAPDKERMIAIMLAWAEDCLIHGRFRGELPA